MEQMESDIHPLLFVGCLSLTEGEAKKGFCLLAVILIPHSNEIEKMQDALSKALLWNLVLNRHQIVYG